jgi:predicted AlkP superfamily phosphohydrolase/phosphomutase
MVKALATMMTTSADTNLRHRGRLVVIGVDAGSPELFQRWSAQGYLPNFYRLTGSSRSYRVENPYGLEAGSVWPVFHTGAAPGRQPQYDGRRVFMPGDYSVRWYGGDETPPTVWRRLSEAGWQCLLVDPPYLPLDPAVKGSMIVDWGSHVPANGRHFELLTHPPELHEEVLSCVGPDPAGGVMCDRRSPETVEEHRRFRDLYLDRIDRKGRLAARMLAQRPWDVALVASSDLHCTGHHLWHVNDPGHPRYSPRLETALGSPLRDCYRAFDASLGTMLAALDADTSVIFYGSHGMGPSYSGTGLLDRILWRLDHGAAGDPGRSVKSRLRHVWHQLPVEWRGRLRPLRRPVKGVLRRGVFVGRYEKRRFFEVYANNATGGIRLNVRGREGHGSVAPEDSARLIRWLTIELKKIVNTDNGEPLVSDVVVTSDRYPGPHQGLLPDLLVLWNRSAPIRCVRSDSIGRLVHEPADNRSGDHTPDGFCLITGPHADLLGGSRTIATTDLTRAIARHFGFSLDHGTDPGTVRVTSSAAADAAKVFT